MTSVTSENMTEQKPDDAPLEVTDIMRLIKAAKTAGYIQAPDGHVKPNGPFQTITLKDLAERNSQAATVARDANPSSSADTLPDDIPEPASDEATEAAAPEVAPEVAENIQPDVPTGPNLDTELDAEPHGEHSTEHGEASQEAIAESLDEIAGDDTDLAENLPKTDPETDGEKAGFKTTIIPKDTPQAEPKGEAKEAEYQRGFEEGQAAAKQELEASLGEAINSFQAAAAALSKDDNIDLTQLDQAMTQALISLASERAGMAITDHPDGFVTRIETMVSRIRNRLDDPVIRLHPQDAEIIQSHLEERLAPRGFKLTPDETLKRGDARVDVGSIGVMDLIDDQVSHKPAAKTKKDTPQDV
jgi:flagellar assembly protein FliH